MPISLLEVSDLSLADPFVDAVIGYFAKFRRSATGPLDSLRGYLAGGLAVRCYAGTRTTGDIDMFFRGGRVLVPPNTSIRVHWEDRDYSLLFDHQYTPDFGLLHPDYASRAVDMLGACETCLPISVLHPIDLAISKVARFQDHDRSDIATLAKLGVFDAVDFDQLSTEAMTYAIGDLSFIQLNLRDAIEIVAGGSK